MVSSDTARKSSIRLRRCMDSTHIIESRYLPLTSISVTQDRRGPMAITSGVFILQAKQICRPATTELSLALRSTPARRLAQGDFRSSDRVVPYQIRWRISAAVQARPSPPRRRGHAIFAGLDSRLRSSTRTGIQPSLLVQAAAKWNSQRRTIQPIMDDRPSRSRAHQGPSRAGRDSAQA